MHELGPWSAAVPGLMRKSVGTLDRQMRPCKVSPEPTAVTRTIENKYVDTTRQPREPVFANPPLMERPEGKCLWPRRDSISQDLKQSTKL